MTRIEIHWNDSSKARGIFTDPKRAAQFLSSSISSRPTFNRNIKVIIDGIEFNPPVARLEQFKYKGRSYDNYRLEECLEYINYCIDLKESFYDDSS